MGAFDNKADGTPTEKFVAEAVQAALAGKKPKTTETPAAAGCRIKYKANDDDD